LVVGFGVNNLLRKDDGFGPSSPVPRYGRCLSSIKPWMKRLHPFSVFQPLCSPLLPFSAHPRISRVEVAMIRPFRRRSFQPSHFLIFFLSVRGFFQTSLGLPVGLLPTAWCLPCDGHFLLFSSSPSFFFSTSPMSTGNFLQDPSTPGTLRAGQAGHFSTMPLLPFIAFFFFYCLNPELPRPAVLTHPPPLECS